MTRAERSRVARRREAALQDSNSCGEVRMAAAGSVAGAIVGAVRRLLPTACLLFALGATACGTSGTSGPSARATPATTRGPARVAAAKSRSPRRVAGPHQAAVPILMYHALG